MPPPDPIHAGQEFFTFPAVTPSEVSKLLASIPSKSSNLDYIPTSILKTCSSIFSPLIARLANLSSNQGQFLSDFQIDQITPLLKKPNLDPTNPANYRQFQISIIFIKSSGASSCFVSGHSSHLLLCSILTSRHTAKATQQKLPYCSLLITSGSLPIVVNLPS